VQLVQQLQDQDDACAQGKWGMPSTAQRMALHCVLLPPPLLLTAEGEQGSHSAAQCMAPPLLPPPPSFLSTTKGEQGALGTA
jgi:hypothetical protein